MVGTVIISCFEVVPVLVLFVVLVAPAF